MPKITHNGVTYDSQLEVDYAEYLKELVANGKVLTYLYHPMSIPNLVGKRSYTPDFLVVYSDNRIEVVETKGFNQFSYMVDNQIHYAMKNLSKDYLKEYVEENGFSTRDKEVVYRKVKYLKSHGWVDFEWKNPNTLANNRKSKIEALEKENKTLKKELKDFERFFSYYVKMGKYKDLTKAQAQWFNDFIYERTKDQEK